MKGKILVFLVPMWMACEFTQSLALANDIVSGLLAAKVEDISIDAHEEARLLEQPLQEPSIQAEGQRLQEMDKLLYKSRGIYLFQSKTTAPVSALHITSYLVEEITLPQLWKTKVRGAEFWANKAWRITIKGGAFSVRAMPAVIWVGDTVFGHGRESADLSAIAAVTFDRSLLVEGATISISYGENGYRIVLPERLKFKTNFQ